MGPEGEAILSHTHLLLSILLFAVDTPSTSTFAVDTPST